MFEQILDTRIESHIKEHKGLYTVEELKVLTPIWKKQLSGKLIKKLVK
jgi:hypothetical protein